MSAVPANFREASPWRTSLPMFLLLVVAILLMYRDTAGIMVGIWWRSETFAHCLLVLPISLWLVWRQRDRLAALTPRPQPWMLLPMLVTAVVWLLSDLVVVGAAAQFALVTMLVLAVPLVLGLEVSAVILFPLLFLYFGVPFGEFVVPTMMELTADFTVSALQISGVPVFREGQSFVIPSGNWSVIDECSGVRYLMASFMVGTLFAYLNYRSYRRRAAFMLFALLMPVLANWLRAYLIVMLAHLSGNKIATGIDHVLYGWVFFGVIIFLMFLIGSSWSQPQDTPSHRAASVVASALGHSQKVLPGRVIALALAGLLVALMPHMAVWTLERAESAAAPVKIQLPPRLADGWSSEGAKIVAWAPIFTNPSAETTQAYTSPAGTVGLHIAYYRGQADGRKLVSSTNVLVPMRSDGWNLMVGGRRDVVTSMGTISVNTAEILGESQLGTVRRNHLVVWRVYWIDGRFVAGDVAAKIHGGLARLKGRGDEGAAVVLYADADTVAASNAALEAFVQANHDELGAMLQRTRDDR
ncbi:MAG: exosortase A [Burkholderiales bacterium PBB1]|nr:MAG: exosortase A [Burkholderiales bacterium PBB1]